MYWRGGSTLAQAARDSRLVELLENERWDYVVLQEQSQIPARPDLRAELMLPAAAKLDVLAKQAGARTVLFMTWGREHGDPGAVPGDTYAAMQARLDEGYLEARAMLGASVAPVGHAWATVMQRQPGLRLWLRDGCHPSRAGAYLHGMRLLRPAHAARSAESRYTGGLDPAQARWLQGIARESLGRLHGPALFDSESSR